MYLQIKKDERKKSCLKVQAESSHAIKITLTINEEHKVSINSILSLASDTKKSRQLYESNNEKLPTDFS